MVGRDGQILDSRGWLYECDVKADRSELFTPFHLQRYTRLRSEKPWTDQDDFRMEEDRVNDFYGLISTRFLRSETTGAPTTSHLFLSKSKEIVAWVEDVSTRMILLHDWDGQ